MLRRAYWNRGRGQGRKSPATRVHRPVLDALESRELLAVTLLTENFNALPLGPSVDAEQQPNVWTSTAPAGWSVQNTSVPTGGADEFRGWTFVQPAWWVAIQSDQNRSQFTKGTGIIAVADSDAFDDRNSPGAGTFNTLLATPAIPVTTLTDGKMTLKFDSSWRPEDNQKATVTVSFDGAAPVQVLNWTSPGSDPNFHADATNESVSLDITVPVGATNAVVSFAYTEARNNWWWALDNISVTTGANTLFAQNFDSLTLGPPVHFFDPVWTAQPPVGWFVDNTAMPAGGTTEFRGWTVQSKAWWQKVTGTSDRTQFTKATGSLAVADPDKWGDKAHGAGDFSSLYVTPSLSMLTIDPKTAKLSFDSSWKPAGNQTAVVTVSYDGKAPVELLRWSSDTLSPYFKASAPNESVTVPLNNTLGALTAVVRFSLAGADTTNWWAIDNIQVSGESNINALLNENFDGLAASGLAAVDETNPFTKVWTGFAPTGWTADITGVTLTTGRIDWAGWAFARPEWWSTVAGGTRSSFTKGSGVVAIADPERWNGTGAGITYKTFLTTPSIPVGASSGTTINLTFDSSWAPGANQAATITVAYDGQPKVEVLRWTSMGTGLKTLSPNESVTVPIPVPAGVTNMSLAFNLDNAVGGKYWAVDNVVVKRADNSTLFSENFESLAAILTPPTEDANPLLNPWTPSGPTGWTVNRAGITGGTTEWRGASFADESFWAAVGPAGSGRSSFSKARGFAAVFDPDQWLDKLPNSGPYTTSISTSPIALAGAFPRTMFLKLDSSWRPAGTQVATIRIAYDGTAATEVIRWSSDPASPFYKAEALDETLTILLDNPVGAESAVVTLAMANGADNGFWGVDNLVVYGKALQVTLLSENFDSLPLGPSPSEAPTPSVFSHTPPVGWTANNSTMGTGGVAEWRGWSFVDKIYWANVSEGQQRERFTRGRGIVAVADGDEWTDKSRSGAFNSFFSSPGMTVTGLTAATLTFDSSFRTEDPQKAVINVSFDGAAPIEILRWTATTKTDAVDESVSVPITIPVGATSMVVTFGYIDAGNNWWWAVDNISVDAGSTNLLKQDFEGTVLTNAPTDEPLKSGVTGLYNQFWTATPPAGASVDNTAMPAKTGGTDDGFTEFYGWTFLDKRYWVRNSGGNGSGFAKGSGVVAVADSDTWDDRPHTAGGFNSLFKTPAIPLSGAAVNTVQLIFDSSWRPEPAQTAFIQVSYDGAAPVEVLRWTSTTGDATFHPDAVNETVTVALNNPAGATNVVVTYGYTGNNNWWWAIDNLVVKADTATLYGETFDQISLTLGASVDGVNPYTLSRVWTKNGPVGWTVDDSQFMDGAPTDPKGMLDWRGWSFANGPYATVPFWGVVTDDQERQQFTKSKGVVAVADPDEYDDRAHGGGDTWLYNSFLKTKSILLSGVGSNTAFLTFDSSWRPEGFDDGNPEDNNQTATITVSYDGGPAVEVMRWDSNPAGAFFKPDAVNETVRIPLNNPATAANMVISFGMTKARNDWWWAIDNLVISGVVNSFQVAEVTPTPSGAVVDFSHVVDTTAVNLFGLDPADFTIVGANTGVVAGSIVFSPDNGTATFLRTGGPLPDDTYTLTLRSATNGFLDSAGALLDGNADGIAGGDFSTTFAISSATRIVSIADVTRGAGQAVNIPANATGAPITVSDGTGLTSVTFKLRYDPALLQLNATTPAAIDASIAGLVGGTLTTIDSGAGFLTLRYQAPVGSTLPAGPVRLVNINATVPATAPYKAKAVLDLSDLTLMAGTNQVPARDDDGVQVATYLGDFNGDGQVDLIDIIQTRRLSVLLSTPLAGQNFKNLDSVLLGDVNNDSQVDLIDSIQLSRFSLFLNAPLVPTIPGSPPPPTPTQDPIIWAPRGLVAQPGGSVTVPLKFLQSDAKPVDFNSFYVVIGYDANLFEVTGTRLGDIPTGFELVSRVDARNGLIYINGAVDGNGVNLEPGIVGDLVLVDLKVKSIAQSGVSPINVMASSLGGSQPVRTMLNGGQLYLGIEPTNASTDSIDGSITIAPPRQRLMAVSTPDLNVSGRGQVMNTRALDVALETTPHLGLKGTPSRQLQPGIIVIPALEPTTTTSPEVVLSSGTKKKQIIKDRMAFVRDLD